MQLGRIDEDGRVTPTPEAGQLRDPAQAADPGAHDSTDHVPEGERWTFDESVADCFEDMLSRSIPRYEDMRDLTLELGASFVVKSTRIIDLGCSDGLALDGFVRRFGAQNRFSGFDVSEPMLKRARERFSGMIDAGVVEIERRDLRELTALPGGASLVLSVLTLQFVPIDYRHDVLKLAYDALLPSGALIVVEKCLGATSETNRALKSLYRAYKSKSGYSEEAIDRKSASLEGVLVPVTADMTVEFLRAAGFRSVECYWRWANFVGFVAVK